jgi:hypothetical protein
MRRIFNIAVLLLIPSIAYATSFTRPYGASDYAGGAKAVGDKVNAEFAYISSWLNGGNIATGNVADLGIATDNIADGAVTADKLADVNIKFTGSSGEYYITGDNTLAQITNLSTTITTTGRPVQLMLQSVATTIGAGDYGYLYTGGNGGEAHVFLMNGSATVMSQHYPDETGVVHRCTDFNYIDSPAAGTQTYSVKVTVRETVPPYAFAMGGCVLVVREL